MKKRLALLLAAALLFSLTACNGTASSSGNSGTGTVSSSSSDTSASDVSSSSESDTGVGRWDALRTTDEPVRLSFELNNFMPTANSEPTEEAPVVRTAAQKVLDEWLSDKPNVQVEWAYSKESSPEWLTINFTSHTAPDLMMQWGTVDLQDNWYILLDDVVDSPNYYEPGSPVWRDMFPEYLLSPSSNNHCISTLGKIVAIPLGLSPGVATCVFYNVDLFEQLGMEPTKDWDEWLEMGIRAKEAGYIGIAQYNNSDPLFWNWNCSFSLEPAYSAYFNKVSDTDGDGVASVEEAMKASWEGKWYTETNPAMTEMIFEMLRMYKDVLNEGYKNIDYNQAWQDGQVAMMEQGPWYLPVANSDTKREFEFGVFTTPIKQKSEYVTPIEYTVGPYNPGELIPITVISPEAQERPDVYADYCIDYLKFITRTDNLGLLVDDQNGGVIGATKTCPVPGALGDWFNREFPKLPGSCNYIAPWYTAAAQTELLAEMERYVYGEYTFEEFCQVYDDILYRDITNYVKENRTYLIENEGWKLDEWADEMVQPSSMA